MLQLLVSKKTNFGFKSDLDVMNIAFILLSLLLAWRIECQGMLLQPYLLSGEGLVGFNHGIVPFC